MEVVQERRAGGGGVQGLICKSSLGYCIGARVPAINREPQPSDLFAVFAPKTGFQFLAVKAADFYVSYASFP
jgi:hypothetical protein